MTKTKLKRIHINQHNIRANTKNNNGDLPVITVKTYNSNEYGHEVIINGPCKIVYHPEKPLSCGTKVWIETESDVGIFKKEIEVDHRQMSLDLSEAA